MPGNTGPGRITRIVRSYQDRAASTPSESLADEVEADSRPPEAVRAALDPLEQEGFGLRDTLLVGIYDDKERQVTTLCRDDEVYYLVHLPGSIIRSDSGVSRRLIASLDRLFPPDSTVFLVSQHGDAMLMELENIARAHHSVVVRFIPWLWLRPGNQPQSPGLLLDAFGLQRASHHGNVPALAPSPTTPRPLTAPERATVSGSLEVHLVANGGRPFFDDFVSRLSPHNGGQARALSNWNEDPSIAANALVRWADIQGKRVRTRLLSLLIEEAPGRDEAPQLLLLIQECGLATATELERLTELVEGLAG